MKMTRTNRDGSRQPRSPELSQTGRVPRRGGVYEGMNTHARDKEAIWRRTGPLRTGFALHYSVLPVCLSRLFWKHHDPNDSAEQPDDVLCRTARAQQARRLPWLACGLASGLAPRGPASCRSTRVCRCRSTAQKERLSCMPTGPSPDRRRVSGLEWSVSPGLSSWWCKSLATSSGPADQQQATPAQITCFSAPAACRPITRCGGSPLPPPSSSTRCGQSSYTAEGGQGS